MKIVAYKHKDMFCEFLNLDKKYNGKGITLYYQIEHEDGLWRRKDR